GIVASGNDPTKVASREYMSGCSVQAASRGKKSVQITDGICEVCVIESVEELSAEFESTRLKYGEDLRNREVQVNLTRATQAVSTNVAYVSASRTCCCRSAGTRNVLILLYQRSSKHRCVEEIAMRHVVCRVLARCTGDEAWTGQRICSIRQPVK